jgi:hypothetical protein
MRTNTKKCHIILPARWLREKVVRARKDKAAASRTKMLPKSREEKVPPVPEKHAVAAGTKGHWKQK